ncbi:MAG TPA: ATP-binding cassette domain-containing protein [Candidatus Baltobacteraceae bacterium]|jgi:ABC-2 type transport system ATP-binding protein|nr:ATP-binding cassette domain-containing protein [Candidatus Baltobacteraceae bacterium]
MLEVDHVRKEFGSVRAVRDVSLSVAEGASFGLLGPNGAGKTTTMRMILGILTPDGGTVRWNGTPVRRDSRRHFGYLPEERGIYGKMKVREQITFFARLHGLRDPEMAKRVSHWIERLGLNEYAERPCSELSKGNQQKVQVACAAVHGPQLLILDEPFSGLDPVNADMLFAILREMQQQGTALILSSHQMWQLEELCSSFAIIAGGENRVSGDLARLRSGWPTRLVRVAPGSDAVRGVLARVTGNTALPDVDGAAGYLVPADTDFAALLRSLVDIERITRFEAVEPSLHEIYLRAIGEVAA